MPPKLLPVYCLNSFSDITASPFEMGGSNINLIYNTTKIHIALSHLNNFILPGFMIDTWAKELPLLSGTIEKDEKFIGGNPDKMVLAMLFRI